MDQDHDAESSDDAPQLPPLDLANPVAAKVLEYLVKKGYTRTEQTLRQESAHLDKDGRPIHNRVEELGNIKYTHGLRLLMDWVEKNLDIYKVSCASRGFFLLWLTNAIV